VKLAFHSIHFTPFFGATSPLVDVLAATARAGFHQVGLDLWSVDAHLAAGGTLASIRDRLDEHGLTCSDVVVIPVGTDDDATVATARRVAEITAVVGSPLCGMAVIDEVDRRHTIAVVRECASVLSERGVRLAIEFTPYAALSTLHDVRELCDEVGWDRAGIMLDTLHVVRAGTKWEDVAALDAAQIAIIQFDDAAAVPIADLQRDSRCFRQIPGEGELPLERFVAAVRATGFDGTVAAEVLSDKIRGSDPGDVAVRMYEALRAYWPDAV
jgi:sugar phosphate isomerase/epimerase